MAEESDNNNGAAGGQRKAPTVVWDDSELQTTYANVVNSSSTREEVTVFFGTNQTWNLTTDNEVKVKLSNRVIMNPIAAKRLWVLLGAVLKEHESRNGTIEVRTQVPETTTAS